MMRTTIALSGLILTTAAFGADSAQETALEEALPGIFARSAAHYRALDAAATPLAKSADGKKDLYPHGYRADKGALDMRSIFSWTSGHYPGSLWYLYEATGDAWFKDRATFWTERLAPNSTADTNHDLGFIM